MMPIRLLPVLARAPFCSALIGISAIAAAASPSTVLAAPAPTASSVLAAEDGYTQAVTKRDAAALDRSLSDQLAYVHAAGEVTGKQAYIASVVAPDNRMRGISFTERDVAVSGDIAAVHGIVVYDMGVDRKARYSAVYRREKGEWRLLYWQNTPMRQDP